MKILKIKNISIKVNIFMLIVFALYFMLGYFIEVLVIVFTVLIHEISHSLAARKCGFEINEIEIFPFGGIARFEYMKTIYPKEEIFICAIGPLSNFAVMIVFMGLKSLYFDNYLFDYIIKINKLMFIINIFPVFPLDGGKIIRAVLSLFIGYKSSTTKLSYITYMLCTIIILYDILNGLIGDGTSLSLIAVFTIIAAKKEREMAAFAFIKSITGKTNEINRKKKMKAHLLVCIKTINIKEALDCFLPNRYHIFIIIKSNGETIGTITESQLLEGIYSYGLDITLEELLIETKK
ncbi:M50 family metallopeptidase [Proteiniborus sp. MB09-C3]|uniref:M50 family metallopeptidase n=1 Tax=Proteiniborus sp. MB09-C3 TaxID=3050072 RepID=UPI002555C66D|nr:M50 family metallopeptidase [Proteiniborus sp. MB09-C3]WIV10606.1 M50 family metallopeptidase [Proteiniborus sp. MB09-C3]